MQYEERYNTDKLKFLSSLNQDTYTKLIHKEDTKKSDIKSNFETFRKFVTECVSNNGKIRPIYSQNQLRGRYYARSPSVQQLSKYIRGFLCSEISTDIDIKNCYPVILKFICDKNEILCPDLTYYVEHRDVIFKTYKAESEEIKKQIFTIMFGGKFVVKNEFVAKFKKEYSSIQATLSKIKEYKDYFDNFDKSKTNKEGGATFKIIEDIEIKVVSRAIEFLKSKNCEILAYMYDGCMIYGDYYANEKLLKELNQEVGQHFNGLNIEFVFKKHIDEIQKVFENFKPEEFDESVNEDVDSYGHEKELFERFCAKIIDKSVFIVEKFKNGRVCGIQQFTENKLSVSYRHLSFIEKTDKKVKYHRFINEWLNDSNMRLYQNIGVFPNDIKVPQGYYNMWVDFDSEFIEGYTHNQEALDMILNHIRIICGNDDSMYDYFIKWIGFLIQFPSKKSICPVFISKEGAGKGTMFELFRRMIGDQKVLETTSPEKNVWGDFNGQMMDCYLVNINELGKKQQVDSLGKIKGLITDRELTINQKGIPQCKIESYHKFIITTNNEDPVFTDENDRRFVVFRSSDEKVKDTEYFSRLSRLLEDNNVIKMCYEYFKKLEGVKDFMTVEKPVCEYHKNLKELNKSVVIQFLEHLCCLHADKSEVEYSCQDLYKDFTIWINNNGIKYETSSLKLMCYIRNLNYRSIEKKHTRTGKITVMNIGHLKKDLKFVDLLDGGQTLLQL